MPVQAAPTNFPARKPDWVGPAVLDLREQTGLSHRKLADTFNRLYFARTGVSVGRTWVRNLLAQQAYRALHTQQQFKHRVPPALANNVEWGLDTTTLRDAGSQAHIVFGLVDHGSRLNLMLRALPRFNTWTLLGAVFLAIGNHGKPAAIRLDNHPVHHAKRLKTVMRWLGIRLRFSQPASPCKRPAETRSSQPTACRTLAQDFQGARRWVCTVRARRRCGRRVWRRSRPADSVGGIGARRRD